MRRHVEKPRHYGKLAKVGLVWGFVREGGNSLLMLPTAMILARLLTPEEAGIAAAANFFTQLCARLTHVGLGASLVRAKEITPAHVSSVFVVNLGIGVLAWGALTLVAPLAGSFLRSPDAAALLPTAALGFLIVPFGTVATSLLSRDMRWQESSTSDWLSTIVETGVAIGMAWGGFSFWSLVYGRLAGDGARALCRMWMAGWWPRLHFSRTALDDMLSFGLGIYAKSLLDFTSQNIDNLIVGRMLGMTSLGLYDKAYTTMHRFSGKLNLSGPSVSFRIFSLIHEEPERFRRAYRKVILSVTLLGYPVLTGMIVTAPQMIEVLFGPRWLPAVVPFQVLCVAGFFRLLNTYASSATQAKGQIWQEVRRQAFFTVILAAAVAGMSRWGIAGAATGVLMATLAMTVMLQMLVHRITHLHWRDMFGPQLPGLACSAGLAVVLTFLTAAMREGYPDARAIVILASCIGIAGPYYLLFLLFSPFREVRGVVHESAVDLVPAIAKRLPWLAPREKGAAAVSAQ